MISNIGHKPESGSGLKWVEIKNLYYYLEVVYNIRSWDYMTMSLHKLGDKQDLKKSQKDDTDRILCHQSLLYIYKIIKTKIISRKYYWFISKANMKTYIKWCNIYLVWKWVKYKYYNDLQSLIILMHWWNYLLIDFVTGLLVSTNWKDKTYDLILVTKNQYIKMIYYELFKINIDSLDLAEVIMKIIV